MAVEIILADEPTVPGRFWHTAGDDTGPWPPRQEGLDPCQGP
jgi:hypothetical protein